MSTGFSIEKTEWGTLPNLWEQNEVADMEGYGIEKLSLYCSKCNQETLIGAKNLQVTVIKAPDA